MSRLQGLIALNIKNRHIGVVLNVLSTLIMLLLCPPYLWAKDSKGDIKNNPSVNNEAPLIVLVEADNVPFTKAAAYGSYEGFDIEFAAEIGARLGRKVQFIAVSNSELLNKLANRKGDMVMSGYKYFSNQQPGFKYVEYGGLPQVYLSRDLKIEKHSDLNNTQVGVLSASKARDQLQQLKTSGLKIKRIRGYYTDVSMLNDFYEGTVDTIVIDSTAEFMTTLKNGQKSYVSEITAFEEPIAIVVTESNAQLYSALKSSVDQILKDEKYSQLLKKWKLESSK